MVQSKCKTQVSVCPHGICRGQIDLLYASSKASSRLFYRTDRNTWPAVISGSICANTELHWDPFYLAANKQWSFLLRYTWVFFPRAQSRTLGAFCTEYAWNRCPLCAANDVAASAVVVVLVSQVDYHPWRSHMYWFLSFTHITCPYLGFNRAT